MHHRNLHATSAVATVVPVKRVGVHGRSLRGATSDAPASLHDTGWRPGAVDWQT
jgi:hypothetical protein